MTTSSPTIAEAAKVWLKIGLLSFGGPAAQIALMHRTLVDELKWLTERQYLNALSFCMLLPGPEAMQLAAWSGWRLHGLRGGLLAGLSFVLPGALVVMVLAGLYAAFGSTPHVQALFLGIKAAVIIIVVEALLRISKRALKGMHQWAIAALAFLAIFGLAVPFPVIIACAAIYGFVTTRAGTSDLPPPDPLSVHTTLITALIWLAIWLVPLAGLWLVLGGGHLLVEIGFLFSKLAIVTFGGAYAVLAYLSQEAVTQHGWLSANEMVDALGLAETTPGPLILVTEFVAYLAGAKAGGLALGIAAALTGLWMTFAPCFLWVFTGAPFIERLEHAPRLRGALAAITAAVVGVILNLGVWFALHVNFGEVVLREAGIFQVWMPEVSSFDARSAALTGIAAILLLKLHWGLGRVLPAMAALGWLIVTFA